MSMSPCTKNCSLNTSTNICEGCGRTLDEIIEWTRMTDEEKQQVMKRLSEFKLSFQTNFDLSYLMRKFK